MMESSRSTLKMRSEPYQLSHPCQRQSATAACCSAAVAQLSKRARQHAGVAEHPSVVAGAVRGKGDRMCGRRRGGGTGSAGGGGGGRLGSRGWEVGHDLFL